jgi:cytoskeletal protein CcmA (bactofilin family)
MLPNFKKPETQFKKPAAASSPPGMAPPSIGVPRSHRNMSVIGPDLTINGNLTSKGELQVDGEVQGDITGTSVVIGERARITGILLAEEIVIRGQVMGSVRGMRVSLLSTSRVEGDIYHQALIMEQGAFFEGKSTRSDDPLAEPPASQPGALNGSGGEWPK